ncbi:MAG: DUF3299 domain-containing protein [Planctomycetaceae bacterium]|nr:DUF3299 domain-containing protein [Planctomycetaceae bacterium]
MKTEFDDALRGMYHEYDEVRPQEEDQYRAIGSLSVTTFVFGLLSLLSLISGLLLFVPVIGLVFGVLALRKIIAMPTIVGGLRLTVAGMTLSFLFGCMGLGWQHYSYYHVTPAGYVERTFFDFAAGASGAVPNEIAALDGQKVFVKGYMYPLKLQEGIEKFALVRTLSPSIFAGATPDPTDMILVEIKTGEKIRYRTKPIRIGGTLRVRRDFNYEKLPYTIEADIVR